MWKWLKNLLNWGEIYESSWWGIGVTTNTIDWGIVYKSEASQDTWNYQQSEWETENNKWNNI
jgi:hypothetical protein